MNVLIAAAMLAGSLTSTAPASAEGGTYWQVETVFSMTHPRQVGSGYWVNERRSSSDWWTKDGRSWTGFRPQGTRPASPADEAKWKADGSPTSWTYRTEGMKVKLSTKPGEGWVKPVGGRPGFHWNEHSITFQELQRFPKDAAALKSKVTADFQEWAEAAAEEAKTTAPGSKLDDWTSRQDYYVADILSQLLYQWPVTKETRTAAFQALKTVPGVRDLGGNTFALPTYKGKRDQVDKLVTVDPTSMTLRSLAVESKVDGKAVPGKTNLTTFTKVGWTDQKPAVPAAD
ncbi:hypothetical protein ACIBG8_28580 [Nonomuraea sp. NPDC050556]|uniref:hypothetical protein n=1 Tax=Nonomuraea sp. NPDC050556 TaxID=3364369 RepID=UPI00378CD2C0